MTRIDVNRKAFGRDEVLCDIHFSFEPGEIVALLGPSGIGKSTLLRLVAGTDTDFDGQIKRPDAIAMVFQEPTLIPWRSVLDNILLPHPALDVKTALQALERVGIDMKAELFPGQLSVGQQRRLSLARAFAGSPELLIMDEPFVSLDGRTADDMLSLTEELIRDIRPATLFVTHSPTEADRLATRILTLAGKPATLAPEREASG